MKISVEVKCLKVPHQWGKIGQRVGQLSDSWALLICHVFFRYKEIALYLRAKTLNMNFQNSGIYKYRVIGDETLHLELSPRVSPHTHTCTLTDLKNYCIH